MTEQDAARREQWLRSFAPSDITFLNLKTGEQLQEPSLIAVKRAFDAKNPHSFSGCVLAAGNAALDYRDTPDVIVYSPLHYGQIADWTAAQHMFQLFFRRLRSSPFLSGLFKPVLCIHEQLFTTEVEERALIDAGIMAGARRVVLYLESLPDFLDRARSDETLKSACVLHIEPREPAPS